MSNETRLEIFADYSQFYLEDEEAGPLTKDLWDDQAFLDMIDVDVGRIAVGTARNFNVPVTVRVLDSEPKESLESWDHVTEAGLGIPSGCLVVLGTTEAWPDASRITVEPGNYRVRVYYGNLDSVAPNGLDGDDHYVVALWPSESIEPRVLKRSDAAARGA